MTPRFTRTNSVNEMPAKFEHFDDLATCKTLKSEALYMENCLSGDNISPNCFSASLSVFPYHVFHVGISVTKEKMFGIYALVNVAFMKNVRAFWDFLFVNFVRNSVRGSESAIPVKDSVWPRSFAFKLGCCPNPTPPKLFVAWNCAQLVNFHPKSLCGGWCNFSAHLRKFASFSPSLPTLI